MMMFACDPARCGSNYGDATLKVNGLPAELVSIQGMKDKSAKEKGRDARVKSAEKAHEVQLERTFFPTRSHNCVWVSHGVMRQGMRCCTVLS
jgi:hypothetical protein